MWHRAVDQQNNHIPTSDTIYKTYHAALVGNGAVGADENVVGDGLAEHLHIEDIHNNLFRLAVQVRMHECYIVIASNHIAQRRQPLLDTLDSDTIGEGVSDVL